MGACRLERRRMRGVRLAVTDEITLGVARWPRARALVAARPSRVASRPWRAAIADAARRRLGSVVIFSIEHNAEHDRMVIGIRRSKTIMIVGIARVAAGAMPGRTGIGLEAFSLVPALPDRAQVLRDCFLRFQPLLRARLQAVQACQIATGANLVRRNSIQKASKRGAGRRRED